MKSLSNLDRLAVSASIALTLSLGAVADSTARQDLSSDRMTAVEGLELLDQLRDVRTDLPLYRAERPSWRELSRIAKLADPMGSDTGVDFGKQERAGLDGSRLVRRSKEDPSAVFEYDVRTGNFLFNGGLGRYRDESSTPDLPKEEGAEKLALERLGLYDLKLDPSELRVAHVGGLRMGVVNDRGGTDVYEKLRTVRFERLLDGIAVEGDSRIIVHLGEQGTLAGLHYQWPQVERVGTLSPDVALGADEIRDAALTEIRQVSAVAEKAALTEVELVLYDDGLGVIEPAYHFRLDRLIDLEGAEPSPIPYDFYVPLSRKSQALFPHMEVARKRPDENTTEPYVGDGEIE